MNLQPITYQILYNQKNITKDVSDYLIGLTYTDKGNEASDELEIVLHDRDKLWQNDWYPDRGDQVSVVIDDNGNQLKCGTFSIDELNLKCGRDGDVFTIRHQAAPTVKELRTKHTTAHEKKTLSELAHTVAAKHGLTVQGTIEAITIGRLTQHQQTDLNFLRKIAAKYGYTFSVRDKLLIFTSLFDLETSATVLSLDKTQMTDFDFTLTTHEAVKEVNVSYHNPVNNKVVKGTAKRSEVQSEIHGKYAYIGSDPSEDKLADSGKIYDIVENDQQADLVAKTAMYNSITKEMTCAVSCVGNVLITSGVNIELTGIGKMSGVYYITESTHACTKDGGYTLSFQAKRIVKIEDKKHYPKTVKTVSSDNDPIDPEETAE